MTKSHTTNRRQTSRKAYSLLEIIISLAILGGAIVSIGQLMYLGSRSAAMTRDLTLMQMLCDSKVAEVAAGALPLQTATDQPIDGADGWKYSVQITRGQQEGLLTATVVVEQDIPNLVGNPLSFSITRFLPDPDYEGTIAPSPPEEEE
jgi:general secretion pathway protein I